MLDRAHDQVLLRSCVGARRAEHREIVRLGATAGEDHLGRRRVNQRRDLPARGFQALLRALPEMVDTRRVTIRLTQARHDRVQHFGRERRGGVMVEIEMLLHVIPV